LLVSTRNGDPQGKVGFGGELLDDLGLLVFRTMEKSSLPRSVTEAPLFVRDREENVDTGDVEGECCGGGFLSRRLRGLAGSCAKAQPIQSDAHSANAILLSPEVLS